jgi:Domain of unknown function (DUF756)
VAPIGLRRPDFCIRLCYFKRSYATRDAEGIRLVVGRGAGGRLTRSYPPSRATRLFQERGTRYSRALPHDLAINEVQRTDGQAALEFVNSGRQCVVFHLYDRKHLDKIPRWYTVDAGKLLLDDYWIPGAVDNGAYDQ